MMAGGKNNEVRGVGDFVSGINNIVAGNSAMAFGYDNETTQDFAIALGYINYVSGNSGYAQGTANTAAASFSRAIGNYGYARIYGQRVFASGRFAALGDAQETNMILYVSTSDATPTAINVSAARAYTLRAGSSVSFSALIIARDIAGTDTAGFKVEGVAYRPAVSGSVVLVGTPTVTALGATAGASTWNVAAAASGVYLMVMATGAASTNIRWVMRLSIAEVMIS